MQVNSYHATDVPILQAAYVATDPRTWPYFPIVMPLRKGWGPASDKDCDEITWEVWDRFCNSHGPFPALCEAIQCAMEMNQKLLGDTHV